VDTPAKKTASGVSLCPVRVGGLKPSTGFSEYTLQHILPPSANLTREMPCEVHINGAAMKQAATGGPEVHHLLRRSHLLVRSFDPTAIHCESALQSRQVMSSWQVPYVRCSCIGDMDFASAGVCHTCVWRSRLPVDCAPLQKHD